MAIRQLQKFLPKPVATVPGDLSITYPNKDDTIKGYFKAYAESATATNVEFYFDDVKISDTLTYQPNNSDLSKDQLEVWVNDGFDTEGFSNGTHKVKAIAYYDNGTTASRTVDVTVNNAAEPAIPAFTTVLSTNFTEDPSRSNEGRYMPAGNPGLRTANAGESSSNPYIPGGGNQVTFIDEKRTIAANTAKPDDARIFIPKNLKAGDDVAVVWFIHANESDEDALNGSHRYHGLIAVANGAIAIEPNLRGSLYSHPDAQQALKNAYKYLSGRYNITKNYMRSTSGGGALATLAYGKDMIPKLRGLVASIGVYDVEDNHGGALGTGVWFDPDDLTASQRLLLRSGGIDPEEKNGTSVPFGKNFKFASRHNPARLTRNHFKGKNIYLAVDANRTPTQSEYMSRLASGNKSGGPGDPVVDTQTHAAMFRQNITQHGGPQPKSFVYNDDGTKGHSDDIIGLGAGFYNSIISWGGFGPDVPN